MGGRPTCLSIGMPVLPYDMSAVAHLEAAPVDRVSSSEIYVFSCSLEIGGSACMVVTAVGLSVVSEL